MASEIRVTNIKANDGTASLTVADSTGNVSVGGALTSTGAITASGGITNAGTISAGTLGASVVFPSGHILQSKAATLTNIISTSTQVQSTATGAFDAISQITITSGNHVLIYAQATIVADNNTNAFAEVDIKQGTVASPGTLLSRSITGSDGGNKFFNMNLWALDTSPSDATTPDYVFTIRRASSNTNFVQLAYDSTDIIKMFLFEVKG